MATQPKKISIKLSNGKVIEIDEKKLEKALGGKFKVIKITAAVIVAALLSISSFFKCTNETSAMDRFNQEYDFVAGKYGAKCYIEGQENKNIKHPIVFDKFEDCIQFVNLNRK